MGIAFIERKHPAAHFSLIGEALVPLAAEPCVHIYWNDKIFSLFTNVFPPKKKTNERIWTGIVCTETGDYLPFSHGTLHAEGWEFADTSRVGVDDSFSAVKN